MYSLCRVPAQDCRSRVNKDPEIVELRELHKRQSQSMRAGLQQQPAMPLNGPGPGNLMQMHTLESGSGCDSNRQ
jgi:hypothetical protein